MHCGNIRDAERVLEIYPDATMNKIYLPHPPDTVDVSCVTMENDKELPTIKIEGQEISIQQQLPQNCQEPFILIFMTKQVDTDKYLEFVNGVTSS